MAYFVRWCFEKQLPKAGIVKSIADTTAFTVCILHFKKYSSRK